MSEKMTPDQVRDLMIDIIERGAIFRPCDARDCRIALQSAIAPRVVTDEDAGRFHDDLMNREGSQRRWESMGAYQRECWRAALEDYERNRK